MRIGEALALKWGDIDFNGRFIHVQRGLSRMKIQTPKNGKTRRVDMSQQLAETLTAYRTECKKKGFALGLGDAPEYVFTNEKGGFIDVSNWRRRVFWKALEKAELRRIRIHDCRHTYATLRISKGDNMTDVSNQLGHYSVKLTLDVYNHWLPGKKKSEVDALDNLKSPEEEERSRTAMKADFFYTHLHPSCTLGPNPIKKGLTYLANPLILLGAGNGVRTRDPQLGKLMLYQLSYARAFSDKRNRNG